MLEKISTNHAVHQIGYHLVWCTKFRHNILVNGVDVIVKRTIGQACGNYGWHCKAIEIMPDHVHLFLQVHHTDSPVNVVKTLKSLTAVAVFCTFPKLKGKKFWGSGLWSRCTYYGSVGNVSQETIKQYIASQKQK